MLSHLTQHEMGSTAFSTRNLAACFHSSLQLRSCFPNQRHVNCAGASPVCPFTPIKRVESLIWNRFLFSNRCDKTGLCVNLNVTSFERSFVFLDFPKLDLLDFELRRLKKTPKFEEKLQVCQHQCSMFLRRNKDSKKGRCCLDNDRYILFA